MITQSEVVSDAVGRIPIYFYFMLSVLFGPGLTRDVKKERCNEALKEDGRCYQV